MPVIFVGADAWAKNKATLEAFARKDWLGELAMRVSAAGMKLVADEFRDSKDPYGNAWAPLKRPRPRDARAARRLMRRAGKAAGGMGWNSSMSGMTAPALARKAIRGPKVLVNTGRMRGSTGASPTGRTARVVIPTWYASVHQDGAQVAPHSRIKLGVLSHRAKIEKLGFKSFASSKRATFSKGFSIPRRQILPDQDKPLPPVWEQMVERESKRFFLQRFGIR